MNRDWLKEKLGDAATDDVVDSIMAEYGKGVNAAAKSGDSVKAKVEELKKQLKELEDEKNANLSDQEKFQKQLDEANAAAAKSAHDLNEMCAVAEFKAAGMTEEEFNPFLSAVIGETKEATVEAAKAICSVMNAKVETAVKAAKKSDLAGMGDPAGGDPASSAVKTKADFAKLSYAKQAEMYAANPEILSQLQ